MSILEQLATPGGLAFIYLFQTALFSMMLYILAVDYLRNRNPVNIYKLLAASSITLINFINFGLHLLESTRGVHFSEQFVPIILNCLFALVVLFLVKPFIYEFLKNKSAFDHFFQGNIALILLGFTVIQYNWALDYRPDKVFLYSRGQLYFALYFIAVVSGIIWFTLRYRRVNQYRLSLALASIVVSQAINGWAALRGELGPGLVVLKSSVTALVPLMFGSVVFKEIILRNQVLTGQLREVFEHQQSLVGELAKMGGQISELSTSLFEKSLDSWERLTLIKDRVLKLPDAADDQDLEYRIREHSRDIEQVASMSDSLKGLTHEVDRKNDELRKMAETVDRVQSGSA